MSAKPQIIKDDGLVIDDQWTLIESVDDIFVGTYGRIGLKPFKESVYVS